MGRKRKESSYGVGMATAMLERAEAKGSHDEHDVHIEHRRFTKLDKSRIANSVPNDVQVPERDFVITITYRDGTVQTIPRDADSPLREHTAALARHLRDRGLVPGYDPFDPNRVLEEDEWRPDLTSAPEFGYDGEATTTETEDSP